MHTTGTTHTTGRTHATESIHCFTHHKNTHQILNTHHNINLHYRKNTCHRINNAHHRKAMHMSLNMKFSHVTGKVHTSAKTTCRTKTITVMPQEKSIQKEDYILQYCYTLHHDVTGWVSKFLDLNVPSVNCTEPGDEYHIQNSFTPVQTPSPQTTSLSNSLLQY